MDSHIDLKCWEIGMTNIISLNEGANRKHLVGKLLNELDLLEISQILVVIVLSI